ncbi:Calcium-dependent protein kinase isoform 2 [Phytophthora nicotianae]|uniref:Calcium-dependent protein kinase isoform 2 n=1 Tax=Phytophthora nicotianae TaxID=4792 RepID=A0A0W8D497_PHYNI|nr:Calcium-dependent protein kinase isoform 2 [Phytophthora nicotianae]
MVLNALELLDKQNQVIVACGKSRSDLPSSVTSTLLSVPYKPDQRVPLIRPDTLAIVYVRRQHIVDCELTARGKTSADVFKDPVLEEKEAAPDTRTNTVMPNVSTNDVDLTFSDSDDEGNASANTSRQADMDLVRLQNRPLHKRARYADTDIHELFMTSDADVPTLETRADIHSSML